MYFAVVLHRNIVIYLAPFFYLGTVAEWIERSACNLQNGVKSPLGWSLCEDFEQVLHTHSLGAIDVLSYGRVCTC